MADTTAQQKDDGSLVSAKDDKEDGDSDDIFFMRQALAVAEKALAIGEVPVGCVIVMPSAASKDRGTIVSHGANQVNATRDATRHAELVAIDRMLTLGASSDQFLGFIDRSCRAGGDRQSLLVASQILGQG